MPELAERPNVILINCDDLGYGDLGCYGSALNKTPALDTLAAEGMRFTSFYQGSPVCSPSRGALLTGCYPPRIGFGTFEGMPVLFPGQAVGLPPTEISIARVLRNAGYRTQMVGKWHCGDQQEFLPINHGFEHYFGLPYSNDMGRQANHPDVIPMPPPLPLLMDGEVVEQQPDQSSLTERYVQEAVKFMRDAKDSPFFLYLAHMYVHVPIYVKDEYLANSQNGPYGAAVESIDWATKVIMRELHSLGLDDNTIVIFTSDNGSLGERTIYGTDVPGGGSNAPLRGSKAQTWEGGLRVPAILRWKNKVGPGQVIDTLLTSMDLYPTIARFCGAEIPTDRVIDGKDVSHVWLGESTQSPHETFAYYQGDSLEAIRDSRWKLHFAKLKNDINELYDLQNDVSESVNVYSDHPDVVARLTEAADVWRRDLGDARTGVKGNGTRPIGRVSNPTPLTEFDPNYPYFMAEYDLDHKG